MSRPSNLSIFEPAPTPLEELAREVAASVLDAGSLSKQTIAETWDLDEEQYNRLRDLVLEESGVRSWRRPGGGFRAEQPRGGLPDETEGDDLVFEHDWERRTVERLVNLFQHRELEKLLGGLLFSLRQARKQATGQDRRGTKQELASALVLQHGVDLFTDRAVRKAVARACGVRAPGRWHSGKGAAIQFVRETGFADELAGLPIPERPPRFEWVPGLRKLKPLADFQKEIQRKLLVHFSRPGDRCIVTLPTGAGKTRTAVETLQLWLKERWDESTEQSKPATVLWLAHTEELCEQAYACFKEVWASHPAPTPLLLARFWGAYASTADSQAEIVFQTLEHPCVLVSTPNRLMNLLTQPDPFSEKMIETLDKSAGLVVIDEAHRAATPSYRLILEGLAGHSEAKGAGASGSRTSVVGLTATPFRGEYLRDPEYGTQELVKIFGGLLEPAESLGEDPHLVLQERGILARPVSETVESSTRIRLVVSPDHPLSEGEIEKIDRRLAIRADNTPRRLVLFEKLREICADPGAHVLYFGPSVRDAECMAFLLRRQRIAAAPISGTTRDSTRRQIVDQFRNGQLQVLCNCQVLTTGFDDPTVTHVVVGRPTVSRVLYEQIVGRGLRGPLFGGTAECKIIDCQDEIRGFIGELGYQSFRRIWDPRR